MRIQAPVSVGELLDKITILQIKLERLKGLAHGNVARELALLNQIKSDAKLTSAEVATLMVELKVINTALWDIEDQIREFETRGDFGSSFIETARSVYQSNSGSILTTSRARSSVSRKFRTPPAKSPFKLCA